MLSVQSGGTALGVHEISKLSKSKNSNKQYIENQCTLLHRPQTPNPFSKDSSDNFIDKPGLINTLNDIYYNHHESL